MTDMRDEDLAEALRALEPMPTAEGGTIVVLATAGVPPAVAMLSTADVFVDGRTVRAALYAGSAVGERLGGAFTVLVPTAERALRLEAVDAAAEERGNLLLVQGRLEAVRPTSEPPWVPLMRFAPMGPEGVEGALEYWRRVRSWLSSGAEGEPRATP